MSQATPPEGFVPDTPRLDPRAPSDDTAAQPPVDKNLGDETPPEAPGDDADQAAGAADAETDTEGAEAPAIEADERQTVLVDETFAPAVANAAPDAPADQSRPARPTTVVRYGAMRSVGEFKHNFDTPIPRGTKVVIRSERGVELGEVVAPVCAECDRFHLTGDKLKQFVRDNGPDYPFRRDGRILRLANPQDVIDYRHLEQSAREAGAYCRQIIRDQKLDMRLVAVEHLLGGERLIFFFAAEHRVDFRELVRLLASQYRTRIEMRQVGARDEARLVADYERCGQQCCCQSFLKDLRPVSMRMAKTQKATLDPSKISGRCGRLMCCLRYEDETYEALRRMLPRKNTYVRTADGLVGRVVDTQIITQLVKIQLPDFTFQAVANEDIAERNVTAPPQPEAAAPPPPRRPERPILRKRERLGAAAEAEAEARREQALGDLAEEDLAAVGADADAEMDSPDADTFETDDQTAEPAVAGAPGESQPAQGDAAGGKKRRRRRRRRKGAREPLAQAAGAPQGADGGGGRSDAGDGGFGGGGGGAPPEPPAGPAGQPGSGPAGRPGGPEGQAGRKSRQRRRRRGPKGHGHRHHHGGSPPKA